MSAPAEDLSFREMLSEADPLGGFVPGSRANSSVTAAVTKEKTANLLILARSLWSGCATQLRSLYDQRRESQRGRRLRVLETVALGEKRFLAIVQVHGQELLIGSSASGVSLLTRLDAQPAPASIATPVLSSAAPPLPAGVQGLR